MRAQMANLLEHMNSIGDIPDYLMQYANRKQKRVLRACAKPRNRAPCSPGQVCLKEKHFNVQKKILLMYNGFKQYGWIHNWTFFVCVISDSLSLRFLAYFQDIKLVQIFSQAKMEISLVILKRHCNVLTKLASPAQKLPVTGRPAGCNFLLWYRIYVTYTSTLDCAVHSTTR